MYKNPVTKTCKNCNKNFETLSPKAVCCSKKCAKALWKKKVKETGKLIYDSGCGRKKGIIPWNKNKKCPQLSKENNGFYKHTHTEETINKIKQTSYITKTKNKSFNTSKEEQNIKELLLIKFPDLKTQYKSNLYPFACDFYIPNINLYIEYQGHWSHGIYNHKVLGLYNKNNPEHQKVLLIWKNKKTKYYDRAIKTWTQLDLLKQQYIENNNLNLLKFYSFEEFIEWYSKLD